MIALTPALSPVERERLIPSRVIPSAFVLMVVYGNGTL
jgi:hypothetical protein